MKNFFLKYQYPIAIIVIGLVCLHLLNYLLQLDAQHLIYPDSEDYHSSAEKMFLKFTGHYYRPMLMAFITGLPYLFGSSHEGIYEWSFYVNVFCWLATSLLLFEIAKNFLNAKGAFLVALLPFFLVGNIAINYHLLTEPLYTFFIVTAFYFLFRYYKTKQFLWLSLTLSLLLLSMLIKPGSKFLAIVFCLYFIKEWYQNYKTKSALLLYFSVLLIVIQVIGMRVQYGNFTLSYIDGVTYHNYLFSKSDCYRKGTEYHQINNPRADFIFGQKDFPHQKIVAVADRNEQLQHNTLNVLKAYVSDVFDNTKSGNVCIQDLKNEKNKPYFENMKLFFFNVSKWQNRFFTLLGLALALWFVYRNYRSANPFAKMGFFIFYIIILSGVSCSQGDRFHLVTFPFVFLLGAYWLSERTKLVSKN